MCELCANPDEKTVLIELRNIGVKPGAKYEAGLEALSKALGYDSDRQQKEVSPYRAVRDLEMYSKNRVEEGLLKLYDAIRRTWLVAEKAGADSTFVLNGRIFINPKTGKPLTKAAWAIIKKDILKAFDYLYAVEEERIALHAMSLGKVIKGLPLDKQLTATYKTLKPAVDDAMTHLTGPEWKNAVMFADQHAGELIVELKQSQYKVIHDTIQNAIQNRATHGQLESSLYDKFGGMNRDWRRIAETEIANAQNNGNLITELERRKPGEETIFVKGISSSEACPFCRTQVDGKIFVLLEAPPDSGGDTVTVNGESYTAIWPGKSNFGRNRANWWVSVTQHPHCVLPGQMISAALPSSATKSFYEGGVVKISLSDGNIFTVTENHPVLTSDGFVAAKFLCKGDKVLSTTNPGRVMESINPDHYQRPVLVEDFYASAKHLSGVPPTTMPVSPEDFHGDGRGIKGKVDVVNTYGLLGKNLEAALFQHRHECAFGAVEHSSLFNSFGFQLKARDRLFRTSNGFMDLLGVAFSNLRGSSSHTGVSCLATIPWDDVGFDESVSEGRATHTEFSREFVLRFSRKVSVDNNPVKIGEQSDVDPVVVPTTITRIETSLYSGDVYDITDDIYGLYACNGVVVKNCRCTFIKYIPGFEKWDDKFHEAMNQAMAKGDSMRKKPPNDYGETLDEVPW